MLRHGCPWHGWWALPTLAPPTASLIRSNALSLTNTCKKRNGILYQSIKDIQFVYNFNIFHFIFISYDTHLLIPMKKSQEKMRDVFFLFTSAYLVDKKKKQNYHSTHLLLLLCLSQTFHLLLSSAFNCLFLSLFSPILLYLTMFHTLNVTLSPFLLLSL